MLPPAAEMIRRVDIAADHWQTWQRRIRYAGPHARRGDPQRADPAAAHHGSQRG